MIYIIYIILKKAIFNIWKDLFKLIRPNYYYYINNKASEIPRSLPKV
jgi:hypothetical protein